MLENNDIEKLFQEAFEGFQPEVDPALWNGIEQSIGNTATGTTAGATAAASGIMKVVGIIAAAAIAATVTVVLVVSDAEENEVTEPIVDVHGEQENNTEDVVLIEEKTDLNEPEERNPELQEPSTTEITESNKKEQEKKNDLVMSGADKWLTAPGRTYYYDPSEHKTPGENKPVAQEAPLASTTNATVARKDHSDYSVNHTWDIRSSEQQVVVNEALVLEIIGEAPGVYHWILNEKSLHEGRVLKHSFSASGDYTVQVKRTNGLETGVKEIKISVKGLSAITKVPNVFSPNNDGVNDVFIVEMEAVETFRMEIYTTSGELIFETNDPQAGWDGTSFGNLMPSGTYLYAVSATGVDQVPHVRKGVLTLSR
jgi:gliding motility-associated-like protein